MAGRPADWFGDHELGGVYFGIVTQNDDPEGPGGRVKVRFGWLPEGDRDQSTWAPLVVPMIGAQYGTYTVPEVDDVVMVMFLSGDIQYPVVLGGAWSQTDPPPETNDDGKNNFRLIKSRSGHRLIFDDTSETKVVVTDAGDRHTLAVGQHARASASPNAMKVPARGSSAGVAASAGSGSLNVWCPSGTLTIDARTVDVSASESVDIVGGQLSFNAGGSASLKATGAGAVQGTPLKLGGG